MPEDEDYELMPHRTIAEIKHELEVLKNKAASKEEPSSKEFKQSMEKLNDNINYLLSLFKDAAEGMKEGKEEPSMKEQMAPLMKRMEELEEENRKIAQGILTVADMVKELKKEEKKIGEEIPKLRPMPQPAFKQAEEKHPMPPRPPVPPKQPAPPRAPRPPMPHPPTSPEGRPPFPKPEMPGLKPMEGPIPPSGPIPPGPRPGGPSPMPPLPEIRGGPKKEKEGFFSNLFKKK